jgi:hypothetical protein
MSSRSFIDIKQFNDVDKELDKIGDDLIKLGIEAGKIKFSDISLSSD